MSKQLYDTYLGKANTLNLTYNLLNQRWVLLNMGQLKVQFSKEKSIVHMHASNKVRRRE